LECGIAVDVDFVDQLWAGFQNLSDDLVESSFDLSSFMERYPEALVFDGRVGTSLKKYLGYFCVLSSTSSMKRCSKDCRDLIDGTGLLD
jgi:hypothetical protein